MADRESELIHRYFARSNARNDVALGIGDDAAVLDVPPGYQLVAAVDTIVEGVHFPVGTRADDVGHRALAVNLSDLAAMGAEPGWFTLALSLPAPDEGWLQAFSQGLLALAEAHGCALVGGDTVRGPLVITIHVMGLVECGRALRRAGARAGDLIYLSHMTGEASAGLAAIQRDLPGTQAVRVLQDKFLRPVPRVELGRALQCRATAAMDVSDGLLIDLERMCAASDLSAVLELDSSMLPAALVQTFARDEAWRFALTGGDDYELLFTAPADQVVPGLRIGRMDQGRGVQCLVDGATYPTRVRGYDHFADVS
jgi:thiamine-monophosphate kinase